MVKSFGSAFTALGLIGALAACASPGSNAPRSASAIGNKSEIGVASRAQLALEKGDHATAIEFAERAVANSPSDAGFRTLLGNAYFAGGRFASAEAAYRDSLTLSPGQPQLLLKLALVQIAQGKSGEALAGLESARHQLDPADYGLALALAGQPQMAVAILEQAARNVGADSRVRQNLALAHALQGDWTSARTVAAQDVPPDQLDTRIQQWMAFAKPARASDQVAALTGVMPAAVDPGQPMRLALVPQQQGEARMAAAEPIPAPMPVTEPAPPMAEAAPEPSPAPVEYAAAPVPAPEPVAFAAAEPAPAFEAPKPQPKRAAKAKSAAAKPGLSPRAADMMHKASFPKLARGNSKSVVQIGAYAQRSFVGTAWGNFAKKYPALRGYTPSTARFESAKGTVYRLSVKGFASDSDARDFCQSLKRAGGTCFVRSVAGDAPVRLASL
jgi:Flp pilus assembly protein TadD